MFYIGQTVYSEGTKLPAIYLGREWVVKGKEYELSHHIFCEGEDIDDWEYCDLAVLTSKSGAIHRGEHSTERFIGKMSFEDIDAEEFEKYLDGIEKQIEEKKLKVFILTHTEK